MLCVLIFVNLCRTAFLWDNPIFVFYYHQTPYTGISFLELNLWDVDQHHPRVAALIGQGMTFALSAGRGFLTHKGSDGSVHVYAALKVPEEWLKTCGVDWTDASAARAKLLEMFAGWEDGLLDLIRHCDDAITPRPIYALPTDHACPV